MDERRELLRRLLSATGAAGRLSPAQQEEILGHLEDSVDAKLKDGVPEMEANVRALEEFGDLQAIAKQFPKPAPVLATADGPGLTWPVHGTIVESFLAIGAFCLFQILILPKFLDVFKQVGVKTPSLTRFIVEIAQLMNWSPLLTLGVVAVSAAVCLRYARRRFMRPVVFLLGLAAIMLICLSAMAMVLPLIAIHAQAGH